MLFYICFIKSNINQKPKHKSGIWHIDMPRKIGSIAFKITNQSNKAIGIHNLKGLTLQLAILHAYILY